MVLQFSPLFFLFGALLSGLMSLVYSPSMLGIEFAGVGTQKIDKRTYLLQSIFRSIFLFCLFTVVFTFLIAISTTLEISIWGVAVATIVSYLFGMLWYSHIVFGKHLPLPEHRKGLPLFRLIGSFALTLLSTWCLAIVIFWIDPESYLLSLVLSILLWIGFSVSYYLRTFLWLEVEQEENWIHIGGDLGKFVLSTLILHTFL